MVVSASGWAPRGQIAAQAPVPGLELILQANQPFFGPGATLRVDIGAVNTGGAVAADFYWGVILPGGSAVLQLTGQGLRSGNLSNVGSLQPLFSRLTVPGSFQTTIPDFFTHVFQGNEPFGRYQIYFAATRPGSLGDGRIDGGDVVAVKFLQFDVVAPVTIAPQSGQASSAAISVAAGGTVQATSLAGATFTLKVPPGFVATDTTITLTPATAGSLPLAGAVLAAVRAAPAGLRFSGPVTLRIELPGGVPDRPLFVVVAPESGGGAELLPAFKVGPTTVDVPGITHFSSIVLALPDGLPNLQTPSGLQFSLQTQVLFDLERTGQLTPAEFLTAFRDNLVAWDTFTNQTLQQGEQATTATAREQALFNAMLSFKVWDHQRGLMVSHLAPPVGDPLRAQWIAVGEQAKTLGVSTRARLGRLARAQALALDAACRTNRSIAQGEDEMRTISRNQALLLDFAPASTAVDPLPAIPTSEYAALGLTFPTREEICVRVDIVDVTLGAITAGQPFSVTVKAGVFFDQDTTPTFGTDVGVDIQPLTSSATPATREGTTSAAGTFSTTFTALTAEPRLVVHAGFRSEVAVALGVFHEDTVTVPSSLFEVSPTQVVVQPGASQQFTATLGGVPTSAVTWTATGGSVSSSGLYTAGTTPGTFFVRAQPTSDSSVTAVAQVTIGATPGGGTLVVSPSGESIPRGGSRQFFASQGGVPVAVTWSVDGGGTITSGGLFTAGNTATSGFQVVRAVSTANTGDSGTATVRISTLRVGQYLSLPLTAEVEVFGGGACAVPGSPFNTIVNQAGSWLLEVISQPTAPAPYFVTVTNTQPGAPTVRYGALSTDLESGNLNGVDDPTHRLQLAAFSGGVNLSYFKLENSSPSAALVPVAPNGTCPLDAGSYPARQWRLFFAD